KALHLRGRLLLGRSLNEGLNGTFSGSYTALMCYEAAMGLEGSSNEKVSEANEETVTEYIRDHAVASTSTAASDRDAVDPALLSAYTPHVLAFLKSPLPVPNFTIPHAEFKWSKNIPSPSGELSQVFPDLFIKVVNEIIGTGGLLESIPIQETGRGLLSPSDFHSQLSNMDSSTLLIDCRNDKEVQIGTFSDAVNPKTKTYNQFPTWVDKNKSTILSSKKKILMYCTGGIRCEKASAYVRSAVGEGTEVYHLKGGVHRYLEEYGSGGYFKGKNFVFDGRQGVPAGEEGGEVVGKCRVCEKGWDTFTAKNVCTVCREQVLICDACEGGEYWCEEHDDLKGIYYTRLEGRERKELEGMEEGLKEYLKTIAVGKEFKSRRRTVMKQLDKLSTYLTSTSGDADGDGGGNSSFCRSCNDVKCDGKCWGYFGLNRKKKLSEEAEQAEETEEENNKRRKKVKVNNYNDENSKKKGQKKDPKTVKREEEIQFMKDNALVAPMEAYSHNVNGTKVRIIPPYLNTVTCVVKPKNAGLNIVDYLTSYFISCKDPEDVNNSISNGGIKVNGRTIGVDYEVKFNDVIKREICVHEPLIKADPISILRRSVEGVGEVYCVNKPASVPTHPAGQYLGNSLTSVVEGELGLEVKSLKPCHRLDKATSGLVLMSTERSVVNKFNGLMTGEGKVQKTYYALLKGAPEIKKGVQAVGKDCWEVDVNIELKDAQSGLRGVAWEGGKECRTRFEVLERLEDGTMKVLCLPREGRGHQIRVHASYLGAPIVGDVLYGGDMCGVFGVGVAKEGNFRQGCLGIMREMKGKLEDCLVCKNIEQSFKEDQLLGPGSEIRLHAWRYQFKVGSKVIDFEVEKPSWMDC
ncbi:hypothetical protein TrST_g7044, partial [Triparma strigata]